MEAQRFACSSRSWKLNVGRSPSSIEGIGYFGGVFFVLFFLCRQHAHATQYKPATAPEGLCVQTEVPGQLVCREFPMTVEISSLGGLEGPKDVKKAHAYQLAASFN